MQIEFQGLLARKLVVEEHPVGRLLPGKLDGDFTDINSAKLEISGLTAGTYTIIPYDTWQGSWLEPFAVECGEGTCTIALPEFMHDMAFKLERE